MITPLDIQSKEFSKSVRGYKEEDVDGFLDLLTMDMEKLIEENRSLKENVKRLNAEVTRYKSTEGTVLQTLEAAKALMEDISASAEKRAEILLKNAELDAELITREARESVDRLAEEYVTLRNRLGEFRNRYKNLLESEMDKFDLLSAELFSDMNNIDDLKGIGEERGAGNVTAAYKGGTGSAGSALKDGGASAGKTVVINKITDDFLVSELERNAASKEEVQVDQRTKLNLRVEGE